MVTLVVETGGSDPDANGYISTAFADTYHDDRANTAWAALVADDKARAIIKATDYIDKRFGRQFRGFRTQKAQALEWPRSGAFDNDAYAFSGPDIVPRQLQKATAEYALRTIAKPELIPDPAVSGTGAIVSDRTVVGPIETEKRYSGSLNRTTNSVLLSDSNIPEYPAADLWLEELMTVGFATTLSRGD